MFIFALFLNFVPWFLGVLIFIHLSMLIRLNGLNQRGCSAPHRPESLVYPEVGVFCTTVPRFHCASGASELNNLDILTDWSSEVEKISGWGGLYMSKCQCNSTHVCHSIYHNHQWQLFRSRAGLCLKPSKPPQMGSTSWNIVKPRGHKSSKASHA